MKATIPVPLQSGTRILHLRADTLSKCYILWLHHNPDYTLGTYLEMRWDGKIYNVTIRPDASEERFRVY